jgi:hypothetical protein
MRKRETEIKVRYSDTFTGNNKRKKNSKEKCKYGKHKTNPTSQTKGGRHGVR